MNNCVKIGSMTIGNNNPLVFIAGPCVIENENITFEVAERLKNITEKHNIPFIFKSSYDKANRTSVNSYRGPGIKNGLEILAKIKSKFQVPILSDVHRFEEIEAAAGVLDIIQIPAFLCRQTDFLIAVGNTGKPVNVKKGQFLAPSDVGNIVGKIESTNNHNILLTERGTTFGYNNLVVDMRSLKIMRDFKYPVIFDATHSVQLPGGAGTCSGGQREFVPVLARAAVAAGVDGIFMEVHPQPDKALCDGPNSISLDSVESLIVKLQAIHKLVQDCV